MAEQSSFFNAIINNGVPDRTYKAEVFARFFSSFIGNGVFPNPATNLQVVGLDNNMTVRVKAGLGWINGYFYENTDDLVLSVDNADGVLNRIDRVVLRLDFFNREIRLYIKKGTFATNPIPSVITRDADVYELAIADIRVNAGVISITQSNITDLRLNTELCGIVKGTIEEIDTSEIYSQIQTHMQETGLEMNAWVEEAKDFFTNEFNTWFDTIKGALDGDVAGNLLNEINKLKEAINNMELTSSNVKRPDGSTVEAALSEHKTIILDLQKQLGGQISRAKTILTNLSLKVE